MTAAVVVELDTRPPVFTTRGLRRSLRAVAVDYTLDEPAVVAARAVVDGRSAAVTPSAQDIAVSMPLVWHELTLEVDLRDAVLNAATVDLRFVNTPARLLGAVLSAASTRAGDLVRAVTGRLRRGDPGDAR